MISEIENSDTCSGEAFTFQAIDNTEIHGYRWIPRTKSIKAILIINHGMAEHVARYDKFAGYLKEQGIAVFGEDHRGHGRTAGDKDNLGFFAEDFGWRMVVQDIRDLHSLIQKEYSGIPIIMFGHSMGSFLTRDYLKEYGDDLSGVILSGTGYTPGPVTALGSIIASIEIRLKGKKHRSRLLDAMSFGSFNKPFTKEGNTGFEWLSRDKEQVNLYHEDPYCGFICTSSYFRDLFTGLRAINRIKAFMTTPKELPLLIISGEDDPVGDRGRGVKKVFSSYKKSGVKDVTLNLIPHGRHESLNEINKEEIYTYLNDWMEKKVIS